MCFYYDFVVKSYNFKKKTYSNFHRCHPVFDLLFDIRLIDRLEY